jgi:hypothetical protein
MHVAMVAIQLLLAVQQSLYMAVVQVVKVTVGALQQVFQEDRVAVEMDMVVHIILVGLLPAPGAHLD